MESMLGFDEHIHDDVVEDQSHSFKLVPWISWDEWKFVRESLFSSSPDSVASALRRIFTWRSRGCIPASIEVTASIVEIQQKDPYFRNDLNDSSSQSEEMLAMLYCMAIMRLVNCVVEKTRKKNEISIGEAADAIGIPRMLIDIRHEGSHRDLPSLQLVRLASNKALDWLVSYYWEPQENAIPIQNNQTAYLRKEIKHRLTEISLCLKAKQMEKSISSLVKSKRSKKKLDKSLKHTLRLYSSFSSEVIYVLLKYLLNALDSSTSNPTEDSETVRQTAFDDWKMVVLKLSRKEPDFLVTLTHAVLEKMESNEAVDFKIDDHQSHKKSTKSRQIDLLSQLLAWLVENLKTLNPVILKESAQSKNPKTEKHLSESTMLTLLRRCLLISSLNNKQLIISALNLAQLTVNASLFEKLKKLALLNLLPSAESNSVNSSNEENSIRQAEERFELIKRRMKGKYSKVDRFEVVGVNKKWVVTKSWSLCPIGMLPSKFGFSGRLPVLEIVPLSDNNTEDCKTILGKREAETGVEELCNAPAKKIEMGLGYNVMRDIQGDVSDKVVKGRLMVDGTWKKVGDEELFGIASAVKLLV